MAAVLPIECSISHFGTTASLGVGQLKIGQPVAYGNSLRASLFLQVLAAVRISPTVSGSSVVLKLWVSTVFLVGLLKSWNAFICDWRR